MPSWAKKSFIRVFHALCGKKLNYKAHEEKNKTKKNSFILKRFNVLPVEPINHIKTINKIFFLLRVGSLFCPPTPNSRVGTKRRAHPTQLWLIFSFNHR